MQKKFFKKKNQVSFKQMRESSAEDLHILESDLCLQDEEGIIQFDFIEPEDAHKQEVQPGVFLLTDVQGTLKLVKHELKKRAILDSVSNTAKILKEAELFFSRLHVYEKLNRPKKRGVLLYSKPGCGKTSAIEKFCENITKSDPGTVVMVWPTSEVDVDLVSRFLLIGSEYSDECTKLVIIMEDIGGKENEYMGGRSSVSSTMLNMLDGVGIAFKLPTFIIATTNHPENLLSSLADRPGRFDLMMKLEFPSTEERLALMSFISKRELTDEEVSALCDKKAADLSIAHLEEIAVRAELHDKTYKQVIEELYNHKQLFSKGFDDKNKSVGFRGWDN